MTGFSTRYGYVKPVVELTEEELPESLLAGLWDALRMSFFRDIAKYSVLGRQEAFSESFGFITTSIWFHLFRKSTDEISSNAVSALEQIKRYFISCEFFRMYEFLEFMAQLDCAEHYHVRGGEEFAQFCNQILEREKSAFRFAGTTLVKVSSSEELEEIDKSLSQNDSNSVRLHIKRAAELYSQRPSPDYRNSVKESISAVEAAVRFVLGKKTYGINKPLRTIADNFGLHPALRDGFEKLYAFTSDEAGIRHALLDEETITQSDAKYMLVSCSAFSNYLISLKVNT